MPGPDQTHAFKAVQSLGQIGVLLINTLIIKNKTSL